MYVSKNLRIILVWPMVDFFYISIYYPSFYLGILVIPHIHFNSNFNISNYKKKILLIAFIHEII